MENPTRIEDLIFSDPNHPENLHLDIYPPTPAVSTPSPAILWFHGGGFRLGFDKRQRYIPLFAQAFAERGYVGIAPDYRARAEPDADVAGTIADAVADGRLALEWVHAHAAEYGIDPRQIVLAGGSAGGMLVLNLVHNADGPLPGVVAVLDLWGTPDGARRRFAAIRPDSPATFVVHGTADALVPYANSQTFCAELAQAGVRHTFLTLPDAPHTPLMHMEKIIEAVEAFLKEVVA
jgi:acetyl esterase/lipase